MTKKISPAAIQALKEALTNIYWYKKELRSFLTHSISNPTIISRLNWDDYKRNIVATLVEFLVKNEANYQNDIIKLMEDVSNISDFSHLLKIEDGKNKALNAKNSVKALSDQLQGHIELKKSKEKTLQRQREAKERITQVNEINNRLKEIYNHFIALVTEENTQQRGYIFEKVLKDLFDLFELDPKASFKIVGEQIDGAFTFDGTDYLLEAKWQKAPVNAKELDSLSGKLSRKLDNTLGLFISINGFSEEAISAHSSGRRLSLLMDGADLIAVLEGRIDLGQLVYRKRRKAAETGNIYMKISEIL